MQIVDYSVSPLPKEVFNMTRQDVIELLGIEETAEAEEVIGSVLAKANELGNVDLAFKQDIADKRVTPTSEIIAEVQDVVFWKK